MTDRFFLSRVLGVLLLVWAPALLNAGVWVSGPMLGHQAHREATVWFETRGARSVALLYREKGSRGAFASIEVDAPPATPAGVQPILIRVPLLDMGTTYEYRILVDGERQDFPYPLEFRTTEQWEWRTNDDPPDFSFLTGSCAYMNDPPYDRPGEPYGKGTEIFLHMADTPADFMVWSGDNIYLREADFSSESGIWYRFSKNRSTPDLQRLLAAMPHYATWDDHDYSSNDGNKSYEWKHVTLKAFQTYWGNPTWGEPDNPGVYGKFFWGDAAFILMDNRYYRDDPELSQELYPEKSQYGARQLDWLKQSLLHIDDLGLYPFKFIVTGSQFLSTVGASEDSHESYRRERAEILQFLRDHDIRGVVFVTGDVHFSAFYRQELVPGQYLYEITSSPLASGSWDPSTSARAEDPALIEDTMVGTQNFIRVALEGRRADRRIVVTCIDKSNTVRWTREIPKEDLGL